MLKKIKLLLKNYLLQRSNYRFFIRDWLPLTDLRSAQDMLATLRFSQNLLPLRQPAPTAKRILVIAPHPDDESIGPGGTLLKALDNGATVHTLYLTSGSPEKSAAIEQQAKHIASTYGYKTTFLNHSPKNIPIDDATVTHFANVIHQISPDLIFLPFLLDDHDDHRRASHLLMMADQQHLLYKNYEIWAYQVYTTLLPNVIIDITDVIHKKEAFIKKWTLPNQTRNWPHFALGLNAYNQRFLPNSPEAKYAECYFVLPLKEYVQYCQQYLKKPADCYYHTHYKTD